MPVGCSFLLLPWRQIPFVTRISTFRSPGRCVLASALCTFPAGAGRWWVAVEGQEWSKSLSGTAGQGCSTSLGCNLSSWQIISLGSTMPRVAPLCPSIPGHSPASPALPHLLGAKEGGGSGGAKNEQPGITTPLPVLLLALTIPPTPTVHVQGPCPDVSSEFSSSAPIC